MTVPETQYAKSGDVNIAYQATGEGPFDLIFVPGYVTHLELHWKMSNFAPFLHELSSFCRLIRFDKRGWTTCGRSWTQSVRVAPPSTACPRGRQ